MNSGISLKNVTPTPPPAPDGYVKIFIQDDLFKTIDEDGVVRLVTTTFFSGSGAPAGSLGNNGDLYLDDATGDLYQKSAGSWAMIDNLQGPQGIQGEQGDQGDQGPQGDPGPAGGGFAPTGTEAAPYLATAATLPITADMQQVRFLAGSGGPVTLAGTPRITAGSAAGQVLILIGASDVDTVTVPDTGAGVRLNGQCILKDGASLHLIWGGTTWTEVARNDK